MVGVANHQLQSNTATHLAKKLVGDRLKYKCDYKDKEEMSKIDLYGSKIDATFLIREVELASIAITNVDSRGFNAAGHVGNNDSTIVPSVSPPPMATQTPPQTIKCATFNQDFPSRFPPTWQLLRQLPQS